MKPFASCALLFAGIASGQLGTVAISVPGEPSINAIFSAPAVTQLSAQILGTAARSAWPNTPSSVPQSTTLAALMTPAAKTATFTSAANIAVCNGLLIDSEVILVTGTAPLVLQRAMIGTTAAQHGVSAPVTVLRSGSFGCLLKSMWFDQTQGIMLQRLNANNATQNSASGAAQQAANLALANAGVQ